MLKYTFFYPEFISTKLFSQTQKNRRFGKEVSQQELFLPTQDWGFFLHFLRTLPSFATEV